MSAIMQIRQANINDIENIAKLISKTWQSSYSGIILPSALASLDYHDYFAPLQGDLQTTTRVVLVVTMNEGTIVGMVAGGINREEQVGYDCELRALYVAPEWQRKGLGKALFAKFCHQLLEYDVKTLFLWTLRDNVIARRFYEKLGGIMIAEKSSAIHGQILPVVAYGFLTLASSL